jgi:hypothetical protein
MAIYHHASRYKIHNEIKRDISLPLNRTKNDVANSGVNGGVRRSSLIGWSDEASGVVHFSLKGLYLTANGELQCSVTI